MSSTVEDTQQGEPLALRRGAHMTAFWLSQPIKARTLSEYTVQQSFPCALFNSGGVALAKWLQSGNILDLDIPNIYVVVNHMIDATS